jgi:hypothetical protein
VLIWDLTGGDQRLVQVFKTTNYLTASADEPIEDELPEVEEMEEQELECEQAEHESFDGYEFDGVNYANWFKSPAQLWQHSKSKSIKEASIQ